MSLPPSFQLSFRKSRKNFRELPALLQLGVFILLVLISVMSLNFEVFRVVRIGDLMIIVFAYMIGVNWYGQRMLEEGYKNGRKAAREAAKNKRK